MSNSPIAIARALHGAIEAGKVGEELRAHFTDDAVIVEHPNSVKPTGAEMSLDALLEAAKAGASLLARQSYDLREAMEQGDLAVLRLDWTGELARDAGPLVQGQVLRAHVAQFVHTRDGRVSRIETYDCYEPFSSGR
ncbi:SnoaL-like domain protein [Enhygromyxa salina]|uniref:SnoaL-like domain protein n=1 Tax=Enhygromyxa salina TaxID=215803 RepID=A0A2S9XC49_9BACT|nr:nuclear transport factor 2 family protein [Enhygromyxa salina]PRP90434.1 SnoaL-like domain protein [Enhygromyxa salina]